MPYQIRQSTIADIPALLQMAEASRQIMRKSGNMHQWINGYPSEEVFRHDIEKNNSYILTCEGEPVGTFAFVPSPEPTYASIYQGAWIDENKPYYVVHRIASYPDKKGIFDAMADFCFSHTDNLRIDTHRDNHIMQHLLEKHGFTYCGIIYLENGDERLAYQKVISQPSL